MAVALSEDIKICKIELNLLKSFFAYEKPYHLTSNKIIIALTILEF